MIELKMTFTTFTEAAEFLLRASGGEGFDPSTLTHVGDIGTATDEGEKPRRTRRTKTAVEQPAGQGEPLTAVQAETAVHDHVPADQKVDTPAPEMTAEQAAERMRAEVRPALGKVMSKFGQDEARQFLRDNGGVEKLSDLPPAKFDTFIAACNAKVA